MQTAALRPRARQRHVERLVEPSELGPLELRLTGVERGLEPFAHGVERHAGLAVADGPQRLLQLALTSEVADAGVVERRARGRGRDRALSFALEGFGVHGGDCNRSFLHAFPPFASQGKTAGAPRQLEDRRLRAR